MLKKVFHTVALVLARDFSTCANLLTNNVKFLMYVPTEININAHKES